MVVGMGRKSRVHEVISYLEAHQGVAEYAELVAATSQGAVRGALRVGAVTRLGPGVYVLSQYARPKLGKSAATRPWVFRRENEGVLRTDPRPGVAAGGEPAVDRSAQSVRTSDAADANDEDAPSAEEAELIWSLLATARACGGVLSHLSAAVAHRWPVLVNPTVVDVALAPGSNRVSVPAWVRPRYRPVQKEEWEQHCSSPVRAVIDCARDLPCGQGKAVADSALRAGDVEPQELLNAAANYRGPGAVRMRGVIRAASGLCANPLESCAHAELLHVPGLALQPQYRITAPGFVAVVDLADEAARLVIEVNGYEFHGSSERYHADLTRYATLNSLGWTVLAFTYRHVTEQPEWMREQVEAALLWSKHRAA